MPGLEDLDKSIKRLEDAQKTLREETRLAHEAAQALKEQRQAAEKLIREALEKVEEQIGDKVKGELEGLGIEANRVSRQVYAKVGNQIDILINLSLGSHKSRRGNKSDIRPMLAEHLKEWLKEQVPLLEEAESGDD